MPLKKYLKKAVSRFLLRWERMGFFIMMERNMDIICIEGVNVKSANGAGDAFTAGVVYGFLNLNSIKETAKFASAAAVIALQSKNTISENLSEHNIKLLLKDEM